jgi:hypothetical protein
MFVDTMKPASGGKYSTKEIKRGRSIGSGPFNFAERQIESLVDDFHDTSCAGLNQNRMVVYVGVPVTGHVILSWYLIVRDSLVGQNRTNAKFLLVPIRRDALAYNVFAKARTIFYA